MTVRDISSTLAPLLELLELEQPHVVTTPELEIMTREAGIEWPVGVVVRGLRKRGWLLDLQTRGAWEFAPAARAGALGAGDPLIELRATSAKNPQVPVAVAAESAAYRLGFSSRRPDREVVAAPKDFRAPKALRELRFVTWTTEHVTNKDGLPVWEIAPLIAFMAAQPSGYHDWPNVGEWLIAAVHSISVEDLIDELSARPRSAWARAAYLLDRGGRADAARDLLDQAPPGKGPYYLGNRAISGRYDKTYGVVDSTGLEVGEQ